MLAILSGLPGTGKSTLAGAVAKRTGALPLRIDSIERAIMASSLRPLSVEDAGYAAACAIAEDTLRLGRTVIADCVNPVCEARAMWWAVAARAGCRAVAFEIICSDRAEHRRRVEDRRARFPDEGWPDWQAVLDRPYDAWTGDRIVIDTATMPLADCVEQITGHLTP